MTRRLGLLVTDASPLITLAAGDALDCLTMPGLRVVIPDMVYYEVTQDLARVGATAVIEWARLQANQVQIAPTNVFSEFQAIRAIEPRARSKGRGEQAAAEILDAELDRNPDLEAVLIYEDSDIRKRRFVGALPAHVTAFSTGDLLHELEGAGFIQSVDHILDLAAEHERNVAAQRAPLSEEEDRALLREYLRHRREGT